MASRVIIDIATSGTDPKIHSILELCAIKTDEQFNIISEFNCFILHRDLVVSPVALAYNGIDLRNTNGWVSSKQARMGFCAFLTGCTYDQIMEGQRVEKSTHVGFGAAKDAMFLRTFLGEVAADALFMPRISELGSIFEGALFAGLVDRPMSARMMDLAIAAGVTPPEDGEHSAFADAHMALNLGRNLYERMTVAGQQLRGEPPVVGFAQP